MPAPALADGPAQGTTPSDADRQLAAAKGCLYAVHGAYMIIAGLCLAVFCWLIPWLVEKIVNSDVVDRDRLPALAAAVLDHRGLMPLTAAPAIVLGLVVLRKVPGRMAWTIVGVVWTLVPAALLIYTFVVSMGLLYQFQPL